MRTIPFRDVLWGVAHKFGLDPEQSNFLSNQAIPVGGYINEWVRRAYTGADYPEWARIEEFTPNAQHIVTWDAMAVGEVTWAPYALWRVLEVYMVDPETTDAPITTRFTEREEGVHVGYEHGTTVWIKFLEVPPEFTAVPWVSNITYHRGDRVYSGESGECYLSKSGANLGNDPSGQQGVQPPPLDVAIVQTFVPATPAIQGQTQITKVTQITDLLNDWQTSHTWTILDSTGAVIGSVNYLALSGAPPADILTAIYTALDALVALNAFTFTLNTANLSITVEGNQVFSVRAYYYAYSPPLAETVTGDDTAPVTGDDTLVVTVGPYPSPPIQTIYNTVNNVQYYVQAVTFVPAVPQIIELTMNAQSAVVKASYELGFTDTGGLIHAIDYFNPGQSPQGILQGITDQIQGSNDPFFSAMSVTIDPVLLKIRFAAYDMVSLNAEVVPMGNAWWCMIQFPLAIADQVIRGATADLYREWGQNDKGLAEEQLVPGEKDISTGVFTSTPNPPLTQQQRQGLSRYKLTAP